MKTKVILIFINNFLDSYNEEDELEEEDEDFDEEEESDRGARKKVKRR